MRRIAFAALLTLFHSSLCLGVFADETPPVPAVAEEATEAPPAAPAVAADDAAAAEYAPEPTSVASPPKLAESVETAPVPVAPVLTTPDAVPPIPFACAPATATPIRTPDLTGEWCGSWKSCTNGHNGPMRATFCRLCNGDYKVTFCGRFCKIIPFRYTTVLKTTGYSDGVVYLQGSQSLGPILGTFSYNAWANDRQFASGYSANKDQGEFHMTR